MYMGLGLQKSLRVLEHKIIYRLLDDVGLLLTEKAPSRTEEVQVGTADILAKFVVTAKKNHATVAGCRVRDGRLQAAERMRVLRGEQVLYDGPCKSIRRDRLEVTTVGKDTECGVQLGEEFVQFEAGDTLYCYTTEQRPAHTEPVVGGGLRIVP